jgi:phosphoribosylanthranilate isomerase
MKKVKIKICGLTRPEDIEFLRELNIDFAGFNFVPGSPRFLTRPEAEQLLRRLPPGIAPVGIFSDAEAAEIDDILELVPLEIIQFHGHEPPRFCEQFGLPYFKVVRVKQAINFHYLSLYRPRAFLLDTFLPDTPGGTGKTFDWRLALEAKKQPVPIILAGGLTPENVAGAVRKVRPWGVDVASGVEKAPGVKDHRKLEAFVEAVRKMEKETP